MMVRELEPAPQASHRRTLLMGTALLGVVLIVEGVVSWYAMLSSLHDGLRAAIVMAPPALAGLWLVRWLRLESLPLRWHLILGAALGLGTFSILTLTLGLLGVLQRSVWIGLLLLLSLAGVARLRSLSDPQAKAIATPIDNPPSRRRRPYLWLVACPFAALALLAAANAPGLIWQEEGFGYDVLEYHLQVPKEYYQLGHIGYLPHNVYANFPSAVEMLYLVAMIVHADTLDIGTTANMIHLLLGALTIAAAWATAREWSPRAGVVGGVVMASAGWPAYLSGLAFVENGMLFFAMTGAGLLLRSLRLRAPGNATAEDAAPLGQCGLIAVAGLSTGFASGCKYTALPLIALPLTVLVVVGAHEAGKRRIADACLFIAATLLALSPWLAKNMLFTGNPVFPLANSVFKATPDGWGDAETRQWDLGHSITDTQRELSRCLQVAWSRTIGDPLQRIGPGIVLIALVGLLRRCRDRIDAALIIMLIMQLAVWLFATHLFARFAVVLLIPLVLLCARAVIGSISRLRATVVASTVIIGAGWNLYFAATLHGQESFGGAPASLIYDGAVPGYEFFHTVNHELPDDARILLVGEARAFYFRPRADYCVTFNRNLFLVAIQSAQSPSDVLAWLREKRYTHLLLNWSELRRLAATYGLSPSITAPELRTVVRALMEIGVKRVQAWPADPSIESYVELFEIPR